MKNHGKNYSAEKELNPSEALNYAEISINEITFFVPFLKNLS